MCVRSPRHIRTNKNRTGTVVAMENHRSVTEDAKTIRKGSHAVVVSCYALRTIIPCVLTECTHNHQIQTLNSGVQVVKEKVFLQLPISKQILSSFSILVKCFIRIMLS